MPRIVPIPTQKLFKIFEKKGFNNQRTAGISREEYFALQEKIS
jgi:predicted RNA binding protein YcfA (HicA-like mRNA interferase family)